MTEEEKELLILEFIYVILDRNTKRYGLTYYGNIVEKKTIRLNDCKEYIARKLEEIERRQNGNEIQDRLSAAQQGQLDKRHIGGRARGRDPLPQHASGR